MSRADPPDPAPLPLSVIARAWTRIGITGFGGPPAHIALLRRLVVERTGWMQAREFEDANAACSLLPGPSSTQLAIFCAYRMAGGAGAIIGGLGFVAPAVVLVLVLSLLFLSHAPPEWVRGAGAGAGAAVAAVALQAARSLAQPSLARPAQERAPAARWLLYVAAGTLVAAAAGPYVVLALLACGGLELGLRRGTTRVLGAGLAPAVAAMGGVGPLAWTALKVGALSFGGGFVIIPLMQSDAVHTYHWMSNTQFLYAVALGQVTPGPVVATVAAVGYAAGGVGGALLAAAVAFAPSFTFILVAGGRFNRLRQSPGPRAFLDGAGPAAIGAIIGASVTLALALREAWQGAVLAAAVLALLVARRGIVETLLAAGVIGALVALAGGPIP